MTVKCSTVCCCCCNCFLRVGWGQREPRPGALPNCRSRLSYNPGRVKGSVGPCRRGRIWRPGPPARVLFVLFSNAVAASLLCMLYCSLFVCASIDRQVFQNSVINPLYNLSTEYICKPIQLRCHRRNIHVLLTSVMKFCSDRLLAYTYVCISCGSLFCLDFFSRSNDELIFAKDFILRSVYECMAN